MRFFFSLKYFFITFFLLLSQFLAHAQKVVEPLTDNPDWTAAYQPFQIVGNLYYVGTRDLACYLITTPVGHILINTGLASSAPLIKANMAILGFKLSDIKILLTTQAHFDHMGAMATIKKQTSAQFMVDAADSSVVADGGKSDYATGGSISTYIPLSPSRILHNNDTIKLGDTRLIMLHHPGHTKGSCSYMLQVVDKDKIFKILIANMPTIVTDKKFAEITTYPTIAADYAYTLATMKNLQFDIWLASHASQFKLHQKHPPNGAYNPNAFIDQQGYKQQISDLQDAFIKKLKQE